MTLWTVARQAPLSMGFSRQEYWSELLCPLPGDLPNSGIKPASLMSPALAGRFFTTTATWEALSTIFKSHSGDFSPKFCKVLSHGCEEWSQDSTTAPFLFQSWSYLSLEVQREGFKVSPTGNSHCIQNFSLWTASGSIWFFYVRQLSFVNYSLALAMGTFYLPLQGLNHVLLQLLVLNTPWKELRVEKQKGGTLCSERGGGETGRTGLQIVRYFQEPILWTQFLYLLIFRKALKSLMITTAPHG